jgi:hypothetical protein
MRKAGGSHMLAIIDAWMHEMKCLPKNKHVGVGGFSQGKTSDWERGNGDGNSPPDVLCPQIDMVHSEFECVNENSLKYIPSNGEDRKHHNVSFFTTLRHPVGRVVSQAFYSGVAFDVVASQIATGCNDSFPGISRNKYNHIYYIHSKCNSYGKKNKAGGKIVQMPKREERECKCVSENYKAGVQILKTNEKVWFDWFNNSVGFADQYMENYFLKRLYVNNTVIPLPARNCWIYPCAEEQSGFQKLKAFIETPYRACNAKDYNKDKGFSPEKALQHVKKLLHDKFDFLILERLREEQTMTALHRIFHRDVSSIADAIYQHDRRGVQHNTSEFGASGKGGSVKDVSLDNVGADVMPPSVQKFLYKQNALDIELYNFAVELFFQKYA